MTGRQPAQNLLALGHKVKAEEREKGRGRGEGTGRSRTISKLNVCSSVLTVDGKESLRMRAERGIVLEKHCVKLYTFLSFIITLQRIFEVVFFCTCVITEVRNY